MPGMSRTWEINRAIVVGVNFIDHVLQFRFRRILAKRSHDSAQLLGSDLSCVSPSAFVFLISQLTSQRYPVSNIGSHPGLE
jgi:hypothetical protein